MKRAIVMSGPPGCGKGTILKILKAEIGGFVIPMSSVLMDMAASHPRGQEIKFSMATGHLVDDILTLEAFMKAWKEIPKGVENVFLDGCVRTEFQAEKVYFHLLEEQIFAIRQINVLVPENECRRRIMERAITEGRDDDLDQVVGTRFQEFKEKTVPGIIKFENLNFGKNVRVENLSDPSIAAKNALGQLRAIDSF